MDGHPARHHARSPRLQQLTIVLASRDAIRETLHEIARTWHRRSPGGGGRHGHRIGADGPAHGGRPGFRREGCCRHGLVRHLHAPLHSSSCHCRRARRWRSQCRADIPAAKGNVARRTRQGRRQPLLPRRESPPLVGDRRQRRDHPHRGAVSTTWWRTRSRAASGSSAST